MANDVTPNRRLRNAYGMLTLMTRQARPDRTRWVLRSSALALVGMVALSGCVTGGTPNDGSSSGPSSGSSKSKAPNPQTKPIQTRYLPQQPAIRFDVLSLGRANNSFVKLRLRVSNLSNDRLEIHDLFRSHQPGDTSNGDSLGGLTLVDGKNLKQYFPRLNTQGQCLCTNFPGPFMNSGQSFDSTITFPAPPQNVSSIDVAGTLMSPFSGIPISATAPDYPGDPNLDTASLKPPLVLPLISTSDDLNGNKSIDDQGNSQDIRLSSDVLFKLNKADLSSKANAILKDVAARLDKASATTVKVDGYTDTSGNDSINNPLSRRRAESVKSALEKLVTRTGITYQTAGHGSKDPVASNKSDAGRKMNRRVTVSFSK